MYLKQVKEHHLFISAFGAVEFYVMHDDTIVAKTGHVLFERSNHVDVMNEIGMPQEFIVEIGECFKGFEATKQKRNKKVIDTPKIPLFQ